VQHNASRIINWICDDLVASDSDGWISRIGYEHVAYHFDGLIIKIKEILESYLSSFFVSIKYLPKWFTRYFFIRGIITEDRTMISKARLYNLYNLCKSNLPLGDFVECGVAKGGCLAFLTWLSKELSVWGFDSFEEMPELTDEDENCGSEWVGYNCSGAKGEEEAIETFRRFSVSMKNVKIVKGWFENTLQNYRSSIKSIAILRLDNDWYKSTKYCLETLYDLVPKGGIIIIDDYHTFTGCYKAVNEFRELQNITTPIITTEKGSEAYWIK
jgi:hypothetical protein